MLLNHPEVATRSCQDCRAFVYNEETGERETYHDGRPVKRAGKPPCEAPEGYCPKGHWENPIELTADNLKAYRHFRRCEAVGRFPEDESVEANATIIRSVIERTKAPACPPTNGSSC